MRFRDCPLLILILWTVSLPAQASPWYPINTGRTWVYSSSSGGPQTAVIQAQESFTGSLCQPLHWNPGAREYLSRDEFGGILFLGATYPDGSYVVFESPIVRVDSELPLGHEWQTMTVTIWYTIDGLEFRRELTRSTFEVIAVGSVTVAAGTFPAVEVLHTREMGSLPPASFRDTYAEDVGLILRTDESGTAVLLQLVAYEEGGIRTEVSSWGEVKSNW